MIFNLRQIAFVLLAPIALAGCATDRSVGLAPNIEVTDLTELPVPQTTAYYGLRPLETLEIAVRQDETLNGSYIIDTTGNIEFPYLGSIPAAGLLPSQLASKIERALDGRYVINPDVTVRASAERVPSISIGGQVEKSGNLAVISAPTLMRAINAAGGTTEYAKLDDVLIFREVGGQRYIGVYNIGAIQRGNYEDPALYPDDIIMVGDSPARRRLDTILQIVPLALSASILLDRVAN